jgi:hypothetical protein
MNRYDVGDLVRCTGTFRDSTGTLVDPTAVFFRVREPGEETIEYQYTVGPMVVRVSTGIYRADVDVTSSGTWRYGFHSTGNGQAADRNEFVVERTNL